MSDTCRDLVMAARGREMTWGRWGWRRDVRYIHSTGHDMTWGRGRRVVRYIYIIQRSFRHIPPSNSYFDCGTQIWRISDLHHRDSP